MKSRSTNHAPKQGYSEGRRVRTGNDYDHGPIINWVALWSRLWFFLKRLVAEIWFLFSRRRPTGPRPSRPAAGTSVVGSPLFRRWSLPLFKVAAALVLFFYVMQRDIQFSIHMKAPLAQTVAGAENIEQMGFAQTIAFGGRKSAKTESRDLDLDAVETYLDRFAQVAQAEMTKFGIPASVKMAQAILEGQAGQAMSVKMDNNHFGAPMAGQPYESAWRNWREHSLLLTNRYEQLLDLGNDYRAWARGLEKAGYSQSPNYANQLLEIIERFHLEQLDESTI